MVIAVNTRSLSTNQTEGYARFVSETFRRISELHQQHEFIFLSDRPFDEKILFGQNVRMVTTGPPARHPILWKLWYDIKIPAMLRKHKADVFVTCDGICSLGTAIPQCLVLHDLSFLHFPAFINKAELFYYKRYTPKFLAKARSVVTLSEFSRRDIAGNYKIDNNKIGVVYKGVSKIFRPLSVEEKTATKNKYTGGREYFVHTGTVHPRKNLVNLLKAFSVFKKRQQTNMKLVIAGRLAKEAAAFKESLRSYKYRDDVVLTGYIEDEMELARLTGSAYGMVYPSLFEGFGVPVLEAMSAGVPVITSGNSAMEEICKAAALYVDVTDHVAIAGQMMLLYKDEKLRDELISKGAKVALEYSWDRTAAILWENILQAMD